MTETTMTDAVHDLVHEWTDVVHAGGSYKPIHHTPLLVMLRQAVRSSTGGSSSGATDSAERSLLNLEALTLQEHITNDVLFLTRKHVRDNPNPMLGYAVMVLAERLDALRATNQIREEEFLAAIRKAKSWRARVWGLLHKPREKDLEFCPSCEQSRVVNADGEVQAALVAFYAQDAQPTAKCRHCGMVWEGEAQMFILGKMIGAEVDREALAAMGIDV